MFKTLCPACGAEAVFRSAASCLVVCEYCNSTLLKDADAVRDIGKMGQVLEDFSPLQIGTSGVHEGVAFTVIGRIQLRYDAGFWNEWYVLGDDGSPAWLSDASGQFVLTRPREGNPKLPAFAEFTPGKTLQFQQKTFTVSDVRTARCVAGEGELPFRVGEGWQAQVVDFRAGDDFLTLDFSEGLQPQAYVGTSVTLEALRCQLLRTPEAIAETSGRYRGKLQALDCPQCGAGMNYLPGVASQLVCAACQSQVDCAGDKAVVLEAHHRGSGLNTFLGLGDRGTLRNASWTVIGVLARETSGEDAESWYEYLLYNPLAGFLWLVETSEGWDEVAVLNSWPELNSTRSSVRFQGRAYNLMYRYNARVSHAAGAFNWRVAVGDTAAVADYGTGNGKLCMEQTAAEITWSQSTRITQAYVAKAFGKTAAAVKVRGSAASAPPFGKETYEQMRQRHDQARQRFHQLFGPALISTAALVLLTLPAVFANGALGVVVLALFALWWPVFSGMESDD